MYRRTATEEIIQEVLKDDYIRLDVVQYTITESVGPAPCEVAVQLRRQEVSADPLTISGQGVGFVDALYTGLVDFYAAEYPSLGTIAFIGFEVDANMRSTKHQGADAECTVSLVVKNTEEREFRFEESNRSLVAATLKVVVEAAEYFINSERAYVQVYRAMCDARERQRPDLIERYTGWLAQLVTTTSYSEVIERIKSETGAHR
ncbi:MAG: hypothetical protein VX589_02380 [Myxococcota bacterium]|nr:hypothetical protein [Myxococcota bacterium]